MNGGMVFIVHQTDISAPLDENIDGSIVALGGGPMERGDPWLGRRIDVRPWFQ